MNKTKQIGLFSLIVVCFFIGSPVVHAAVWGGAVATTPVSSNGGGGYGGTAYSPPSIDTVNAVQFYMGNQNTGAERPIDGVNVDIAETSAPFSSCSVNISVATSSVPTGSVSLFSFSGSELGSCNGFSVLPTASYTLLVDPTTTNGGFASADSLSLAATSYADPYILVSDLPFTAYGDCSNGGTVSCIDTVIPPNGSVIPDGSFPINIEYAGYVATKDDPSGGIALNYYYAPVNAHSVSLTKNLQDIFNQRFNLPINGTGEFNVSTDSDAVPPLTDGTYFFQAILTAPLVSTPSFNFFGFNVPTVNLGTKTLAATSTVFAIGAVKASDLPYLNSSQQIALTGTSTNNDLVLAKACSLFESTSSAPYFDIPFNWDNCMIYTFIPDDASMQQIGQAAQSDVETKWPIGYVTRFASIIAGDATTTSSSTLPDFTIAAPATLPNGQPFPVTGSLNLNLFGDLTGSSSYLYSATSTDGKTLAQVIDPYNNFTALFVTAFAVLFIIVNH